jgi:hypothetical protein
MCAVTCTRTVFALLAAIVWFDGQKPSPLPVAMGLTDRPGPPAKTYLLHRGEPDNRGAEVQPGFPLTLVPGERSESAKMAEQKTRTGRRLALANWVASADNPLTARVVERTASWMKGLRRMRVRYDRLAVIRDAFTTLAAAVVCFRILINDAA